MRTAVTGSKFQVTLISNEVAAFSQQALTVPVPVVQAVSAPVPVVPALSREQRRKNAAIARLLERRLEKDGTPVEVVQLPDGGLHMVVKQR